MQKWVKTILWRSFFKTERFILLQLTASPWTTEASTSERWQFEALTNRKATSSNRAPSLSSLYYYQVALSLYRDKWTTIIRLWWLSQWLLNHGHHLAVTIIYMWRHLLAATIGWHSFCFCASIATLEPWASAGGENGHLLLLEIGINNYKILENLKSGANSD